MFSVVIPLYNKELSINNTICSVLNQTFGDFEIIIVNDGSTDNSENIVKKIGDDRVRLLNQKNQGVSAARNTGIQNAKYEWIAFLDGDDLWEKNHLEEIHKMMKIFPSEKIFVTSFEFSDKRNMFKHPRNSTIFKIEDYFKEAIKESLIWTSVVVINANCFESIGVFDEQLNRGEDLDLWSRLARQYAIIKSSIVTATYRIDAENRSDTNFILKKSNVYTYDFADSKSVSETTYYKFRIIQALRGFLVSRRFNHFFKLRNKHKQYINYSEIFF